MADTYISLFSATLATRTTPETALRIRYSAAVALCVVLTAAACDRLGEIVIVPEYQLVDSFESGMGAWSARTGDLGTPPGNWTVQDTQAAASDGLHAVSLQLDNVGGAGKVWIVRQVELAPAQEYDVDFAFDLGTQDKVGTSPWTIIAGAYPSEPQGSAGLTFRGGTGAESPAPSGVTWVEKRYAVTVRATSDGKGVVVLGVWGMTSEDRTYYLDNVRVSFTRR